MKPLLSIVILLACPSLYCQEGEYAFPQTDLNPEGYALAVPNIKLEFPRDHGSHPDFKTEWWYITGHLASPEQARRYGFQITFFRSSTDPISKEQIYMAHAALIDKETAKFVHEERLNSDRWNAHAAEGHLDIYNGNWSLRMLDATTETMATRFSLARIGSLHLNLKPEKAKTLFGDNGYSKKGDSYGAASYYITFTRLSASGSITIDGEKIPLSGLAWMDHEFSSSQLASEQIGWNWTSLILDDGRELMAYVMRRSDGQVDPNSRLTLIDIDGTKTERKGRDFSWEPIRHWISPHNGARYPVEYRIAWEDESGARKALSVRPFADDQELRGRIGDFVYWEGAGQAFDESGTAIGQAYTELTGYAESLNGKF